MSNQALARTHRPRLFGGLATQVHVSETLRTAVINNRVAHAYLFCGPRGVGKTTAARVLAMALNCPRRTVAGEPCGSCESCEKIWSGKTSLDVVEIDAASNRGVDDARDLRERAMYAPTDEKRFKIYIIDEAHMLTREAWNALLKILEEPPPRVVFIFATTEPQKIQQQAAPILSRCQRFDFKRITVPGIVERLRNVLEIEGIYADDSALLPIARRADGGMRDALSLLDQVLSFSGKQISAADVTRVLGLVPEELYLDLFDILAQRNFPGVFRLVQRVLDEGYDLPEFYKGLSDALRAFMVAKFEGAMNIDVREDLKPRYLGLSARFAAGDLLRMLGHVAELDTEGRFRKSANPRTLLEALLLRWAHLDRTIELESLLAGQELSRPHMPQTQNAPAAASPTSRSDQPRPAANVSAEAVEQVRRPTHPSASTTASGTATGITPNMAHPVAATDGDHFSQTKPRATSVGAAFANILEARNLPLGLGVFLKAAQFENELEDQITLTLPPGPGFEQISDAAVRRKLELALSEELGRSMRIALKATVAENRGTAGQDRLTPEKVKHDQLARMSRDEPAIGHAVKEWDLELLD